jgi:hypothetical protein
LPPSDPPSTTTPGVFVAPAGANSAPRIPPSRTVVRTTFAASNRRSNVVLTASWPSTLTVAVYSSGCNRERFRSCSRHPTRRRSVPTRTGRRAQSRHNLRRSPDAWRHPRNLGRWRRTRRLIQRSTNRCGVEHARANPGGHPIPRSSPADRATRPLALSTLSPYALFICPSPLLDASLHKASSAEEPRRKPCSNQSLTNFLRME